MLDRATPLDEQFLNRVRETKFFSSQSLTSFSASGLDKNKAIDLFDSQIKSRHLDLIARQLKDKGLAYYTIGSSGHEGNVAFGQVFKHTDMAFLHYRSGAFYQQRSKQVKGLDGVRDVLLSLVAAADDPIAGGRHKVFGSVPLFIPPETSTIASHLPKALGAAISITRANELYLPSKLPRNAVILCSFGDASINHASAQATLNAAAWVGQQSYPLPLIFICEDNGLGISVPTPEGWIENTIKNRSYIHYISCDGLNLADCYAKAIEAEHIARNKKKVVFLHMRCVRLLGHAGSDIESQYLSQASIESTEARDPLIHTAGMLFQEGWMTQKAIIDLYEKNRVLIKELAMDVIKRPKLGGKEDIMSALLPRPRNAPGFPLPDEARRVHIFGANYHQTFTKRNLCQLINFALVDSLLQYPNLLVFGEDVGKKGGVYRVTADLQTRFGSRRVFNTILDETTILGTAIGMAHNGFLPVPEIQFLAYLHNAEDQLRGEASTLSFFSNGQYQNPMVIRVAGLAYQKGFGGHFHNDNSIAVLRDLPGVVVACPSNGADAARLLRTCLHTAQTEGRVMVFLEPIALYMTKDLHAPGDNAWLFEYPALEEKIPLGAVSTYGEGDTVILTYANGYYLSRQAEKILKEEHHIPLKIVDLHWLVPLPKEAILRELSHAKRVLIVDEGRRSGSVSEGLMTLLMEYATPGLTIKRLTGEDCFIPLGNAWQYLLPSRDKIVDAVKMMIKEKGRGRLTVS
jgi:2-oxoisovalerate dehydrogenase E1 component